MRIRRIVMIGLGVGAVALLALAGCTETARGDGQGLGQNGGQGYRGVKYEQTREGLQESERGLGRGQQARDAGETARGGLRGAAEPASERTGRDVADAGTLQALSGTLATDGTEWYLDTADGRFLLHLGNHAYVEQTGLALEAGEAASAKGIVDADEVSVVSLTFDGKTYAFRSEDGRPLWAGGGQGGGRSVEQGTGAGQGLGRGAGRDA